MRVKIWEKDDFFSFIGDGRERIDMDPVVVECKEEPLPLTWNFNFEKPPIGNLSDIRIENEEITGEVTWFENTQMNDELLEIIERDFRFGGYYKDVLYTDDSRTQIESCTLRGVGLVLKSNMPGWGANPGARL